MNDILSQYDAQEQDVQNQIYIIQQKEKKILMILDSLVDEEFQVATDVLDQLNQKKLRLRQQYFEIVQNKQQEQQKIVYQQSQQNQNIVQESNIRQDKPKIVKRIYYIDGQMVKQEDNLNESLHFSIMHQEKEYQKNMQIFKSTQQQKENQPNFVKKDKPQQQLNQQKLQNQQETQKDNLVQLKQQYFSQKSIQQQIEKINHPKNLTNAQLYNLYKQGQYNDVCDRDSVTESQRDLLEELYIKQVLQNNFPNEKMNYGAVNFLKTQESFTPEVLNILKDKFYTQKPQQKQQQVVDEKIRDMIDIYQSAQLKLWEKLDKQSIDANLKDANLSECEIIMNTNPQNLNPIMINQLLEHNKLQSYFQENMGSFLVEQINYINLKQRLKDYDLDQHNIQYDSKPRGSSRDNETFQVMSEVNLDTKKVGYFQSDQKIATDLKFNNFDPIEEESIEGQTSKVQDEMNDSLNENFQNYSCQKNNFQCSSNSELKIQQSYSLNQCKKQKENDSQILKKQMELMEEVQNLKLRNSNIKKFKEDYDINVQISLMSQSQKNSNIYNDDNDFLGVDNGFKNLLSHQNSKNSDKQINQSNTQQQTEQNDQIEQEQNEQQIDQKQHIQKSFKMSLKDYLDQNLKIFSSEKNKNTPKSTFSFREQNLENKIKQPNTFSLQNNKDNRDRNKDLIEFLKIKIRSLQKQIDQMKGKTDQKSVKQIEELELKRSTLNEHVTQITHKNSFEPQHRRINLDDYNTMQIDMSKKQNTYNFTQNTPQQVESLKYNINRNFDQDENFNNFKKSIQIINNYQ